MLTLSSNMYFLISLVQIFITCDFPHPCNTTILTMYIQRFSLNLSSCLVISRPTSHELAVPPLNSHRELYSPCNVTEITVVPLFAPRRCSSPFVGYVVAVINIICRIPREGNSLGSLRFLRSVRAIASTRLTERVINNEHDDEVMCPLVNAFQ